MMASHSGVLPHLRRARRLSLAGSWLLLVVGTACSGGTDGSNAVGTAGGIGVGGATSTTPDSVAGGVAATGQSTAGGASAAGGATSAGTGVTGGTTAAGGGTLCPFPTSFQWSSSGVLAEPPSLTGHDFVSLKDFTHVYHNGQHIVYASVWDTVGIAWDGSIGAWSSVSFTFADWSDAAAATKTWMGNLTVGSAVAPTLFYFTPKSLWVLITQWGLRYATSSNPTDPSTWTATANMLDNGLGNEIDPTVICDSTTCYLFFARDNGHIYRSSMAVGSFPGPFDGYEDILTDTPANLYEGVQVYSVKGTGEYLMIVEAMGAQGRYFRAFRASSLGGTFTAIPTAETESQPFAGKGNVTFTDSSFQSNDISHGDLIRIDASEKQEVDPCNLQFLYQGYDPSTVSNTDYEALPYRPALLTRTN